MIACRAPPSPAWATVRQIAQGLNVSMRELGAAVFPHVKAFYSDYFAQTPARQPFYAMSARK